MDSHGTRGGHKPKNRISERKRNELFRQYVQPNFEVILKYVRFYIDKAQNVDDDFNYVITQMFKYIHTYNPVRSLKTWLHIVTKRSVFNQNARRSKVAGLFSNEAAVKEVDDEDFMAVSAVNVEAGYNVVIGSFLDNISDEVYNALMKIPSSKLSPFLLQMQGYSIRDIVVKEFESGHIDRQSEEIIKSRIFWTRHELQRILKENGIRRKNAKDYKNADRFNKEDG